MEYVVLDEGWYDPKSGDMLTGILLNSWQMALLAIAGNVVSTLTACLSGVADILAYDLRFISALIRDDFPTLDFPANAISGSVFSGSLLVIPHTVSRLIFLIIIYFSFDPSPDPCQKI